MPLLFPLLLASGAAHASGLDVPGVGPLGSGPTSGDAAATWFNPAMLTELAQPELLFGAGIVAGQISYQRDRRAAYPFADGLVLADPVPEADLDPSKQGLADPVGATPFSPWGNLFIAGPVYRDRLFLGGSLSVPYAAPVSWPADGAQRWALQEAQILVPHATLAIAGTPHPAFRIGASVSYVLGLASLSRTQDFAGLDLLGDALRDPPVNQPNDFGETAPSTVREQDVLARPFLYRNGLAHGVSFSAGLAARPHERVWIAASYEHGARLDFEGSFQLDLDDPFFTDDLASNGLAFPARVEGEGTLGFRLPHRVRAGLGVQLTDRVRLDLLGEGVLWSTVDVFSLELRSPDLAQPELGIPDRASASVARRWVNAAHATVRVSTAVGRGTVIAEVGYQSPASPDATVDASSPDGHRLTGGLGGTVLARERVRVHLDGRIQAIVPRVVTTSDFDLANGRYDLWLASLAIHVQARLDRRSKPLSTNPSPQAEPTITP